MRKYWLGIIALSLVVAACATSGTSGRSQTATALHVLDCGDIGVLDQSQFSPGVNAGQRIDLKNTCYVIEHPRGTLMWDTGLPDAVAAQPDGIRDQMYHIRRKQTLAAQLGKLGIQPESVNYIAMSHLHFDHSGNANVFIGPAWLVQRPEYETAFSERASQAGFDSTSYNRLKGRAQQINGDHDVFGDSSVVILSTPGHTIGHQSLLVRLPSGKVLLSGDLWHFRANREHRRVPSFNFDRNQTLVSMDRVEQLLKLHNARLIIQHDPEDIAALGTLPATLR